MLILQRCPNEVIDILTPSGEKISVMVVRVRGDTVRLGFEADKGTIIHRREVALEIERKQREAG